MSERGACKIWTHIRREVCQCHGWVDTHHCIFDPLGESWAGERGLSSKCQNEQRKD